MAFTLPQTQFLCATVGWPGSGKSTWAESQLRPGKVIRVNRDSIRLMLGHQFNPADEKTVYALSRDMIAGALQRQQSVIVDDTNLSQRVRSGLISLANYHNVPYIENRTFLDVPLEECFRRDSKRLYSVGKDVIERMYYDYWKAQPKPTNEGDEAAIIVDIDGTLAHTDIPYPQAYERDYTQDSVNEWVARLVHTQQICGTRVLVISGRDAKHQDATTHWLREHLEHWDELIMRPVGDKRADFVVKKELFMKHIQGSYRVLFAIDDRPSVVRMWRAELGLNVLHVAPGMEF